MIKAWRYLAAGVAAYVLVLIVTFPAQKAAQFIEQQVDELDVRAPSGTLFSGQAQQLVYQGLDLGPVRWRFRPQALLSGRLEYHLEFTHAANTGQANLGRTLAGNLRISAVELVIQPDRLINHYSPMAIGTSGTLRLDIDVLEILDHFPGRISGQADWTDAALVEPLELALGQLTLLMENDAKGLLGTLGNAADAGINGELRLGAAGDYTIDMLLRPGADVSAETLELLRNSLQQQPDGDFILRVDGQL
ncbi:MAG: type II secretion system protein N [Gammaproteobacteria bacterium]